MSRREHTAHDPRDTMTKRNGWYDPPVAAPTIWKRLVFRFAESVRTKNPMRVGKMQRAASRYAE